MNKMILNLDEDFKQWYYKYNTKILCNENHMPSGFPCIILWTEYSIEAKNLDGIEIGVVEYVDHEFVYESEFKNKGKRKCLKI